MQKWSILAVLALVFAVLVPAQAGLMDVEIKAMRKKGEESKSREGGPVTKVSTEVIYTITLNSKSFKPIQNLTVKYALFYYDVKAGSTTKPIEAAFRESENVPLLPANGTFTFATKPLTLSTETLDGGWYYGSGASSVANDKISGVWIRAYADGKMVGEYVNPVSLPKRQEWKD